MSGGHFEYQQHKLNAMAASIDELMEKGYFSPETHAKFLEAAAILRLAYEMVHRIDWLASADDGEDTFHKLWPKSPVAEIDALTADAERYRWLREHAASAGFNGHEWLWNQQETLEQAIDAATAQQKREAP